MVVVSTPRITALWRETGKYRAVQATPEEIAKFRASHSGRYPDLKMLACDCGARIWGSGLGTASHNRKCTIVYTTSQLTELAEARRARSKARTYGQLQAEKITTMSPEDLRNAALSEAFDRKIAAIRMAEDTFNDAIAAAHAALDDVKVRAQYDFNLTVEGIWTTYHGSVAEEVQA
jgi:hypothetical protein